MKLHIYAHKNHLLRGHLAYFEEPAMLDGYLYLTAVEIDDDLIPTHAEVLEALDKDIEATKQHRIAEMKRMIKELEG